MAEPCRNSSALPFEAAKKAVFEVSYNLDKNVCELQKCVSDASRKLAEVRNKSVEYIVALETKSYEQEQRKRGSLGGRSTPSSPGCGQISFLPFAKVPGVHDICHPMRRVVSDNCMSSLSARAAASLDKSDNPESSQHSGESSAVDAGSSALAYEGEEAPSLEDLALKLADTSRKAFVHAQSSIEQARNNAQENWGSLVSVGEGAPTDPSPPRLSRLMLRVPTRPDALLESVLQLPRRVYQPDALGALWEAGQPTDGSLMGPFQLQALRRKAKQDIQDPSCLREKGRHVAIVTTASLPWMTGTAVNPLLRAAFLADKESDRRVTLMIPWLNRVDQARVFPNNMTFTNPEEQEAYVRQWVEKRTGRTSDFKVSFYPGRYAPEKGSILPVGDITQFIPAHEADVAILEEPEHLNWYHHGSRWTKKFNHVVGVMHTNYLDYARREEGGALKEAFLKHINAWVCRAHCHKVIKLSDAVQALPRQCTTFVHGVSPTFLEVGKRMADAMQARAAALQQMAAVPQQTVEAPAAPAPSPALQASDAAVAPVEEAPAAPPPEVWTGGAYFLGKVLWAKGYTELMDLLEKHKERTGSVLDMDVYGSGDDFQAVRDRASASNLCLKFHGAQDHADASLNGFKVFVNPSVSDVVATTTAEALAMGKFVVCAEHPCNEFFSTFSNCLIYRTPAEFSEKMTYALTHEPRPMPPEEVSRLTWEDATERFLDAVKMTKQEHPSPVGRFVDNIAYMTHNTLTGMEMLRINAGAGANTMQTPQRVTDYQPDDSDLGGIFDNKARAQRMYRK